VPHTPIYLDHNATTPVDPRVLDAMLPYFRVTFGNPASAHAFGCTAHTAVEQGRQEVADLIGADPREVVFTSGATEANNLAVKGVAQHYRDKGRHIVTAVHEHPAVVDPCKRLVEQGYEVTWLRPLPGSGGRISGQQVAEAIRDDTVLVSIMWANNEVGTINDIAAIGQACRERGVLLHTDATQAVGKLPIDVNAANVDLLSASAHKFHGPKGVGFLYVRRKRPRVRLVAQMDGGGHERQMRSGTLNVPGIVGLRAAAQCCAESLPEHATHLASLRDRLETTLMDQLSGVTVNGRPASPEHRLPNTSNLAFADVDATALLRAVPHIAASTGSACSSATLEPSYVLRSLDVPPDRLHASIRFSVGRTNTIEEVEAAVGAIVESVKRLRASKTQAPTVCDVSAIPEVR